jgi:hypothetical protein
LKATAEADSPGDPTSIAAQAAERLEAMSATLSPFSVEYSRYENEDGTNFIGNSRLRVGDLRLARAALDKPQAMSEAKMSDDIVNRAFVIACCREPVGAGDGDTYVVSPPTMASMRAALEFALRLAESHPSTIREAVEGEREACAKIAEGDLFEVRYRTWPHWNPGGNLSRERDVAQLAEATAAAIRARGEENGK